MNNFLQKLQTDERPKGVCGVPFSDHSCAGSDGCLVIVGKLPPADTAFLPSSAAQQYSLTLQFHSFIPGNFVKLYVARNCKRTYSNKTVCDFTAKVFLSKDGV